MLLFKLISVFLFILGTNGIENDTSSSIEIIVEPLDVVVLVGQNASFTCKVPDNETYTVTWLKNGKSRHSRRHPHWQPNGTELLVANVRADKDCANITCAVSNEDGENATSSAALIVISKLNVSLTVENVSSSSVDIGYSIAPDVLKVSNLTFNIHYNATNMIQSSPDLDLTISSGVKSLTGLSPNTEYLFWMTARAADGISVNSEVKNFKTLLAVPRVAPALKNVTAINSTAVLVEWFPINNTHDVVDGYTIMWKHKGHSQNRTINGSATSSVIAGLRKFTNYTVKVAAYNSIGLGPYTDVKSVLTEPDVPRTAVHNLRSTSVNSSSISLRWNVNHRHKINGPLLEFVIRYYRTIDGKANSTKANTSSTSYTLNDLSAYTNYSITVSVYNGYSIGPDNDSIVVRTAEGIPETSVHNLQSSVVNSSSLSLSWNITQPDKINGPLLQFMITYYPSVYGDVNAIEAMTFEMSYTLNDLSAFTNYTIIVSVSNGNSTGPDNDSIVVKTPEGKPSGVRNLSAITTNAQTVSIQWSPPLMLNGILSHYQITINEQKFSTNVTHTVRNLNYNTTYNVTVTPWTGGGSGPTAVSMVTTGEGPPSLPPTTIKLTAINGSMIRVSWQPPPQESLNGILRHFRLEWRGYNGNVSTITVGGRRHSYRLTDLKPFTEYDVRIAAVTIARGPFSNWTTNRTKEATPSAPTNLSITLLSSTSISIEWSPPNNPNGQIRLYGVNCGRPLVSSFNSTMLYYECQWLEPGRQYKISVFAYTGAGEGEAVSVVVTTPCELPKVAMGNAGATVVNLNITRPPCNQAEMRYLVVVQEVRTDESGNVIAPMTALADYTLEELIENTNMRAALEEQPFRVGKRQTGDEGLLPVYIAANTSSLDQFTVGDGKIYGDYKNYELNSNNSYRVAVAVLLGNQQGQSLNYSSPVIIKTEIPVLTNESPSESDESSGVDMLLIIIIAAAIVIAIILVSVVLLFICCMCHGSRSVSGKKEKEELGTFERAGSLRSSINSIQLERNGTYRSSKKKKLVDPVEQRRSIIQTPELDGHPPIPVDGFLHKLSVLEECERQLFIDEFASLQDTSPELINDVALMDYNFAKNRYNNILPYDHTRVKLSALKHVPGSDYINANYCDGYMKYRGYIATQGPLPSTVPDFWRMIWEQRCNVIVMLTRLEEGDRIKCHCYWPKEKEGTVTFGVVQVRLADCVHFADYSIRTFRLSKIGHVNEVTVTQFHYTSWPDHGVPSVTTTMLMFVRRVQSHCATLPEDSGPITVHCSAGVGRTGCYIVIDSALTRLKEKQSTVDIYGHVSLLRSQRPYMVQHEEQYFFTYEAVAEAIMCGDTECSVDDLPNHVEMLNQITEGSTLLEKEFKRLALEKGDPQQFLSAKKPINKDKNRYVNVLPYENSRVVLDRTFGEDSSDYINASYINGYFTKNLFIATQSPLAATMVDFWRMLWEQRSPIVVMVMERGVERYWPVDRIKHYGYLSVEPTTERHSADYTYREFKLTHSTTDEVHIVRHFQFLGWPEIGVPSSGLPLIELMEEVNKMYQSLITSAPITVHCKPGVAVTGVLAAMRVLLDQLKVERAVNVFQAVKVLRIQRPAMVQTMEQYRFLYDALEEYVGSDMYCRQGPSPLLYSSCTKLPYYGNELHTSTAHTFSSTTDVHAGMQHSNI